MSGLVIDSDGSHVAVSISEYETYGMSFENSVWNYIEARTSLIAKSERRFYLPKEFIT
jgi:hypothetical protein